MDFLHEPDLPSPGLLATLDPFESSADQLCTNQFTCGVSNSFGNVAESASAFGVTTSAFAKHLLYFYLNSDLWSIIWMLWMVGMLVILLDTLRIFRNCVVIFRQISRYIFVLCNRTLQINSFTESEVTYPGQSILPWTDTKRLALRVGIIWS